MPDSNLRFLNFGIFLCLLFLSASAIPHPSLKSDFTEIGSPDLGIDSEDSTPNIDIITDSKHWNVLSKSSRHHSDDKTKVVRKARYFMAVCINTESSSFKISPKFLSLSVSPRKVAGSSCIPWYSKKLKIIARSLRPMWLRVGGTETDYITFVPPMSSHQTTSTSYRYDDDSEPGDVSDFADYSGHSNLKDGSGYLKSFHAKNELDHGESLPNPNYNKTLHDSEPQTLKVRCKVGEEEEELAPSEYIYPVSMEMLPYEWDRLHQFAQKVNWRVIFGLNVQLRGYLDWDMSNAITLIDYTLRKGYKTAWELGNEPSRFPFLPNVEAISPEQLSYDFFTLKTLLKSMVGGHSFIAGPDIPSPSMKYTTNGSVNNNSIITHSEYLERFLEEGAYYGGVLDAMTWHYYSMDGRDATVRDFISYSVMDQLLEEVDLIRQISGNYSFPIWLGETGDAFHRGVSGLSNSFLSGFLFMDKLGLSAALGIQVLMQHTLVGINGLLEKDLEPLPNYWIAVLHKFLVGTRVLSVQNGLILGRKGRVYAHCTKHYIRPPTRIPSYSSGDVTLLVVNTYHSPLQLMLLQSLKAKVKDVYIFTPLDYNLRSKSVTLNQIKLSLTREGGLPRLLPRTVKSNKEVTFPGLSYGYVVIRDAKAAACTT